MTIARPYAAGLYAPARNTTLLVQMKAQLDDLGRQLGTGKRAETLGQLGAGRTTSLSVRAKLAENAAFRAVNTRGEVRGSLMSGALQTITETGSAARGDLVGATATGAAIVPAAAQAQALGRLETIVAALNTDFDGQFLFSGTTASQKPVIPVRDMLDGAGGAAGVTQLIDERRQADLGDGLGRLALTRSGASLSLSEEAASLPFGMKLADVTSSLSGTSAALAGSDPDTLSINVSAPPQPGESLRLKLAMPDGTQETVTLTARTSAGAAGTGDFAIGADAASTAANMETALRAALGKVATTRLAGASTVVATDDFFAGTAQSPPRRIAGPPFATATAFAAAGSRATVNWYLGDADPAVDPRETQVATADVGVTLAVGGRANELPIRNVLAGLAAIAAAPVPSTDQFQAVAARSVTRVNAMADAGREIVADIGVARKAMSDARTRLSAMDSILTNAVGQVEDAPIEEVSTAIMSLQTRLQASYQVTASLSRLNLADYLR